MFWAQNSLKSTCCHDDSSQDFPSCMGGGEVVSELAEFIHHQARDGISQNLKSQAGVQTKKNLDTDNNNACIRHVSVVFS